MKKKSNLFIIIKSLFLGSKHLDEVDVFKEDELQSPFRTIVKNFLENKIAMTGLVVFSFILFCSLILPFFYPLDTSFQDSTQQNVAPGLNILSVPSSLSKDVEQISVGSTYSFGIDNEGELYSWGQLSNSKLLDIPEDMGDLVQISTGLDHVLALSEDGIVYTWGNNRLGLGDIPSEVEELTNIAKVYAGQQLSFVITDDGYLYSWGNTNIINVRIPEEIQGKVVDVQTNTAAAVALTDEGTIHVLLNQDTPLNKIPEEIQGHIVDFALTSQNCIAVTDDGMVYVWGGLYPSVETIPDAVQGIAKDVAAGRNHVTVVTTEGTVYSWGRNVYGEANAPSITNAVSVSAGYYQNYVVLEDNSLVTWGLSGYIMGTDAYGRDVLNRLIAGGQMTILIGAIAVLIQSIIGILVGGFAGYYGGRIDNFLMRMAEVVGSIPFIPLAMILSAVIGSSISEDARIIMIMVILGVLSWPGLARLIRGQVLAEKQKEFVTAAKAMGLKERVIIFKHILPNVITVIIVSVTLSFASSMLTETSLSFLGFGVLEPRATWGNMLTGSQSSTVIQVFWWRWVFPALALGLSTISINLIGDGLRNAIDPKSNER
ncbi:MAG: ABC transporter permease subunit [Clostridia bacterium]